jgi:hypothetical protein
VRPAGRRVSLWLTFAEEPDDQPLSNGHQWIIDTPMLPGQGFFAMWSRKAPVRATSVAKEVEGAGTAQPPPSRAKLGS